MGAEAACVFCGYDASGLEACPECGAALAGEQVEGVRRGRRRAYWLAASGIIACGVFFGAMSLASMAMGVLQSAGLVSFTPLERLWWMGGWFLPPLVVLAAWLRCRGRLERLGARRIGLLGAAALVVQLASVATGLKLYGLLPWV